MPQPCGLQACMHDAASVLRKAEGRCEFPSAARLLSWKQVREVGYDEVKRVAF